jgi:hypothetical protein
MEIVLLKGWLLMHKLTFQPFFPNMFYSRPKKATAPKLSCATRERNTKLRIGKG